VDFVCLPHLEFQIPLAWISDSITVILRVPKTQFGGVKIPNQF
jgi:hypothetical protein